MEGNRPYSSICNSIKNYLKEKGISNVDVARELELSPSAVSKQLSGNKPFGRSSAEKWAKLFPFRIEYLQYGQGDLLEAEYKTIIPDHIFKYMTEEDTNNIYKLDILLRILDSINLPKAKKQISNLFEKEVILVDDVNKCIDLIKDEFEAYRRAYDFANSFFSPSSVEHQKGLLHNFFAKNFEVYGNPDEGVKRIDYYVDTQKK